MSRLPTPLKRDEHVRPPTSFSSRENTGYVEEDTPQLSYYSDMLLEHRWLIASIVTTALIVSTAYVTFATPIYRANILLQIEDFAPSSKSFLTDTTGLGELNSTPAGEIQVISSRTILGSAVDQTNLQVDARPRYLPLLGAWIARTANALSDPGFFGMKGVVTGNERINVQQFKVPPSFEDTEPFIVTALGEGKYAVSHPLLEVPLEGEVNTLLEKQLADGRIVIRIINIAGLPGAEFTVGVSSRLNAIEQLQQRLIISEQGRQSNVVSVALEDSDRNKLSLTLTAIGEQYVRQNVERKSAEAEKTLSFLNAQLPIFERQLKTSEDAFAKFRNEHGTVAFDEEARVWLKGSADLQSSLLELQQSRLELTRTNNDNHPKVQTLDQQISIVRGQLTDTNKKIAAMPNVQRDALRLERDVRANSAQYQSMQNNALQMRLLKEGRIGNVRLLDNVMVPKAPVKPQKQLIVALALVMGALIGTGLAIFLSKSKRGIRNPNEIAMNTGLEIYGVIPKSPEQTSIASKARKGKSIQLLAELHPRSASVEALRGLRIGLKLALENATNNRILITGPTSGIGKSFIANNFAALLSQTGKRVLIINADLRKFSIEGEFGLSRQQGLAELLQGDIKIEEAIRLKVCENLDVLTNGTLPSHPADLLESTAFTTLLNELSTRYDHIVIDTAPILFAADALAIAPLCGCVLLVAKADDSQLNDLTESIRRLAQAGAPVDGLLLNGSHVNRRYSGSYESAYRLGTYRYGNSETAAN